MTHEDYMRQCLALAAQAKADGNIPVGALIVCNGEIIAQAYEELPNGLDITAHAEILAVKRACLALNRLHLEDCTLYTTAEPCWMCAYTIRESRISQVVIGAPTPDVGSLSTRYPLLSDPHISVWDAPPQIITGILEAECRAIREELK